MHSVRLAPTKLILIGTRATYQATGDAGCTAAVAHIAGCKPYILLQVASSFSVAHVCSLGGICTINTNIQVLHSVIIARAGKHLGDV